MECLQRVLGEFKNTPKYQHSDEAIMNIMLWKHHASRNLKPTPIWYDLKLQGRESFSNLKAGRICAIIGLILSALYLVFIVLYIMLIALAVVSEADMPWELL